MKLLKIRVVLEYLRVSFFPAKQNGHHRDLHIGMVWWRASGGGLRERTAKQMLPWVSAIDHLPRVVAEKSYSTGNEEKSSTQNEEKVQVHAGRRVAGEQLCRRTWGCWLAAACPGSQVGQQHFADSVASLPKEVFFLLYLMLARPHLEYRVLFRAPQCKRDVKVLEGIHGRATRQVKGSGGFVLM